MAPLTSEKNMKTSAYHEMMPDWFQLFAKSAM
jgi:hypothetical protein